MKRPLQITGIAVGVLIVALLGSHAVSRGWLHALLPERQIAQPLSIDLHGPKQTIAGQEYYFHVEIEGEHGAVKWTLVPEQADSLTPSQDGLKARFQSSNDGLYSIIASVGGNGMQADSAHIEFDNMAAFIQEDEPVVQQPANGGQPAAPFMPVLPPDPTVRELVLQAYDAVDSDTKAHDAAVVVGCLRSLASRLSTGQLPPSADVAKELADHVEEALGEKANDWALFIAEVRTIILQLRLQGDVTTAASAAPALIDAADALEEVVEH